MRFLSRVSLFVLVIVIELFNNYKISDLMMKTFGIQPNNIGKSLRVLNAA